MTDVLEMIDDLRELQKLYAMNDICFMDFQEKLLKYENIVERFEQDLDEQFEASYAGC
jgi:hypothetical protein